MRIASRLRARRRKCSSASQGLPWCHTCYLAEQVRKLRKKLGIRGAIPYGYRHSLATDALAHWSLKEHEAGRSPWEKYEELLLWGEEVFVHWVEQQRDARGLRNDDVTLVAVCL